MTASPEQLDAFAPPASFARDAAEGTIGDALLRAAEPFANALLDQQGTMHVWEVRIAMQRAGLLENQGKEDLDALGALGRRMDLASGGSRRIPPWAQKLLPCSHANRHTTWRRKLPTDMQHHQVLEATKEGGSSNESANSP